MQAMNYPTFQKSGAKAFMRGSQGRSAPVGGVGVSLPSQLFLARRLRRGTRREKRGFSATPAVSLQADECAALGAIAPFLLVLRTEDPAPLFCPLLQKYGMTHIFTNLFIYVKDEPGVKEDFWASCGNSYFLLRVS